MKNKNGIKESKFQIFSIKEKFSNHFFKKLHGC